MPSDTFSNTLGYLQMVTGNDNNTWGNNANVSVFQIFEDALANVLTEAVTGGTLDLSGSAPPAGPSQVRFWQIKFTGTLTSNQIVKVPNLTKQWIINNQTTGAFTLSIQTPSGSPVTVLQGGWVFVWCDGNNNININPFSSNGGFNVLFQSIDGSTSFPGYGFYNEQNSGWRRAGTNDLRLVIGGADVLQVTGAGAGSPNVLNLIPSTGQVQLAGNAIVLPGTEIDYVGVGSSPPTGWLFPVGQAVSRMGATANLFNAMTATATGNTHSNTTVDGLSTDLRNLGFEGALIEGTGISLGTTIVSINSATSMTISSAASSTSTGITLRILPYGQGDGSTTFNVPDRRGRIAVVRDNLGGTAAGRITVNAGTHLATNGGEEQHLLVTAEIPALTHGHTITEPNSGQGHQHTVTAALGGAGSVGGGSGNIGNTVITTSYSTTGITINNTTLGGGGSHNTMPPFAMCNRLIKL